MVLKQIDVIGLEPRKRSFNLAGGDLLITPVDFRHQENFVAIAAFR